MRSVPLLGSVAALATLGTAVRRKGVARGALDTALDMMPVVGALKNALEVMRGSDFVPDRATPSRRVGSDRPATHLREVRRTR
jgi:hypothetical protein